MKGFFDALPSLSATLFIIDHEAVQLLLLNAPLFEKLVAGFSCFCHVSFVAKQGDD